MQQIKNSRRVYIMEACNANSIMLNKKVNYLNIGAIAVGSIVRFPCPMPIESHMKRDIPLIVATILPYSWNTPLQCATSQ